VWRVPRGQQEQGRGRLGRATGEERAPGQALAIDWGEERFEDGTVHVVCAVSACSRIRFVRFASDERARDDGVVVLNCAFGQDLQGFDA
jgi:hypothetical protein